MQSHVEHMLRKPAKYRPSRPNDYIYDPTYLFSSPRDYQRCVLKAAKEQAEFQPQPNYPSMFSDHPRYPRIRWSLKHVDRVPAHINRNFAVKQMALLADSQKQVDVTGIYRHLFFGNALVSQDHSAVSTEQLEDNFKAVDNLQQLKFASETRDRSVQTEYRDTAAQTNPWAPPYFTSGEGSTPEILTLAMLSWENGLPAGMHEVEIIERLRIKRAWEKVLPPMDNPENIQKRKDILEAIERDEWSFREKEIETIHQMRLDLAKHHLDEVQKILSTKMADRLERLRRLKEKEKEIKTTKINIETNRALRKLTNKHKGVSMRYRKPNVIDEYTDKTSEFYGPLMRHGENPKRRHEVITIQSNFLSQMKGLEILEKMPKWIPTYDFIKATALKRKRRELCIHETRWTDEVLAKLYKDLKAIRMDLEKRSGSVTLHLVKKIHHQKPLSVSGSIEGIRDSEENTYQAATFLQAVIKGRAIQAMMSEGREKCQDLIEDYKRTKSLDDSDISVITDRLETRMLQRELAVERDQLMKVSQDTVDTYLEDIILESMDWMPKSQAREYIKEVAKKIDRAAEEAHVRNDILEQEELVSSLIHTFVIPEAEKIQARKQIRLQQEKYLRVAHAAIYGSDDTADEEEMEGVKSVSVTKLEDSTENTICRSGGATPMLSVTHAMLRVTNGEEILSSMET
ncbi:cilia- and flagella-associated protein 91-like isoform X3 [Schistocerca serialis cubense]|uniref:cilia- and flagella-associated protein 91-like isoform X3 n=1 Tax=Schistocerca serialis cubense TaxID=2023355 RepID=UPI00214E8629|nr:cilia- and flagella-associated protein 91-like isoform X3 [Schistocerca serialis cubense]